MFVWHREELLVTVSTEYYLRVRALLQQNDIKMQCRQVRIRHHGKQEMLQNILVVKSFDGFHPFKRVVLIHADASYKLRTCFFTVCYIINCTF